MVSGNFLTSVWREMLSTLYETFLVNCWDYRAQIIPVRASTIEALELLHTLGMEPDLIYVDAGHDYTHVYQDVETARQLFPRATLVGDHWAAEGVQQAVRG
jgi:hypothetical protein